MILLLNWIKSISDTGEEIDNVAIALILYLIIDKISNFTMKNYNLIPFVYPYELFNFTIYIDLNR